VLQGLVFALGSMLSVNMQGEYELLRFITVTWLIGFVFIRTFISVFVSSDPLSSGLGCILTNALLWQWFKISRWPGKDLLAISIALAFTGYLALLMVEKPHSNLTYEIIFHFFLFCCGIFYKGSGLCVLQRHYGL
jgi:hypothetical protein